MRIESFLVLITMMVLSLCACGNNLGGEITSNQSNGENSLGAESSKNSISVDESLLYVEITVPASFYSGMSDDEINSKAEEKGFASCTINENGSVTLKMTKSKRDELLDEYKTSIEKTIQGCLSGEDKVESFVDIKHNEDFSQFDFMVDSEKYSLWDNMYVIPFYVGGAQYQAFSGTPHEDIDVAVNFIDKDSLESIFSGSYKNYINNNKADDTKNEDDETDDISLVAEIGETVTIDDLCEYTIEYADLKNEVKPPKPQSYYTYYSAADGAKYVDISIAYKNLSTSSKEADEAITGYLLYCNKYKYVAVSVIEEDNRGDFTYARYNSIDPLSTEYIHLLFEVPESAESTGGSLVAVLNFDGNKYRVVVRDGKDIDVESPDSRAVMKSSGSVNKGEVVAIKDVCEFFVEYGDITNDVIPPSPASYYSHYEADDGKVYVDVSFFYKSWKKKSIEAKNTISAKLKYAGKYEYDGFTTVEKEKRGDFTYSNLESFKPLIPNYIHYLFEVPSEIEESNDSVEVEFKIGGNSYLYKVR